ncbi:restriction endonuclease subunit S [Prevotella communis]|uniref:restriction endonuclease subunit S n=1 Tax=Prevotella communis TaxID=2913614 RepID=UPI001EDC360E|nr:restriction endonuclease subunit S [Prevotella communis]UKK58977.1 restriction endonuclease subunit S [Prevotella communis]
MVEWKKLSDVAVIKNGKDYKKLSNGTIPVYGTGGIMTYVDQFASDKPSVLLPRKGSVENIFYVDKPFWTVDTLYWTDIDTSRIAPKFLFMSLQRYNLKEYAYGGARPSLSQSILYNLDIPLPSLSEQQRIVEQLDTFTSSIENLKEQIAQRRKQYEYYRDQLLDLEGKEGVEMKSLNDLCTLITKQTGFDYTNTIKPSLTVKREDDSIPFIQNKDFEGTVINLNTDFFIPITVAQKFPKILLNDKILLVSISGRIGNVGLYDLRDVSFVGGAICVCRLKKDTNGRYVLYFLQSQKGQGSLFHSVKAASHANITVEAIRKTIIPLPSLSEQQRIVSILDTFEASVANLEQQLAQREKQYEYYRNKLLTFE